MNGRVKAQVQTSVLTMAEVYLEQKNRSPFFLMPLMSELCN